MLNRYFAKTLSKGFSLQKMVLNSSKMSQVSHNAQLVHMTKMSFFDYDNKDKNIFTSDSDDSTPSKEKKEGRFDKSNNTSDNFFNRDNRDDGEQHQGRFELDDIPMYISKMRNEMTSGKRFNDNTSYFGKVRNFISMHHQNKAAIFSEFPRSTTVFYEYMAYRGQGRENQFLKVLEDNLIEGNIQNMPIAGVKNVLRAMSKLKRNRASILENIEKLLIEREGFKDVKSNLIILRSLQDIRYKVSDEYMLKSFEAFQNELNTQIDQEVVQFSDTETKINSIRYTYTQGTLRAIGNIAIRHLLINDISISESDVQEFNSNHTPSQADGLDLLRAGDNTSSLTSHLLLALSQLASVNLAGARSHRGDLPPLKYLEACQPAVVANLPNLKEALEKSASSYKAAVEEAETREDKRVNQLNKGQLRVANALDEMGIFYKNHERFHDCYLAQFYLPNEDVVLEYHELRSFLRNDNNYDDRLLLTNIYMRNQSIKNLGTKFVIVDFLDAIENKESRQGFLDAIKQKIDNA